MKHAIFTWARTQSHSCSWWQPIIANWNNSAWQLNFRMRRTSIMHYCNIPPSGGKLYCNRASLVSSTDNLCCPTAQRCKTQTFLRLSRWFLRPMPGYILGFVLALTFRQVVLRNFYVKTDCNNLFWDNLGFFPLSFSFYPSQLEVFDKAKGWGT